MDEIAPDCERLCRGGAAQSLQERSKDCVRWQAPYAAATCCCGSLAGEIIRPELTVQERGFGECIFDSVLSCRHSDGLLNNPGHRPPPNPSKSYEFPTILSLSLATVPAPGLVGNFDDARPFGQLTRRQRLEE
jgi:hypothetical protein